MPLLSNIEYLSSKIVQDNPELQVLRKVCYKCIQHTSRIAQPKFKLKEKLSYSPPP